MMDLRYHLVSLMAVFLALAVGIVVGSSLGSSERQTAIVQQLQERFDRVMEEDRQTREENEALRRRLEAREQAERQLMPAVIQGRLAGNRLAVIICGDGFGSAALSGLRQALTIAGAQITSVTRLPSVIEPLPAEGGAGPAASAPGTRNPAPPSTVRALTRAILAGDASGRLAELARAARVSLEGEYRFPVRRVLVIAAPPASPEEAPLLAPVESTERIAETVLATAQEDGVQVIAAEPEEADGTGFLHTAAEQNVTTIDNIDTASGQIALVLALARGARGRFGSGPGATQPIPP